jgi:hypothetical protein
MQNDSRDQASEQLLRDFDKSAELARYSAGTCTQDS